MVKSSTFFRVSLGLATLLGSADAVVFLPTTMFKILFGKQEKGPGVLVDVIGADLLVTAPLLEATPPHLSRTCLTKPAGMHS